MITHLKLSLIVVCLLIGMAHGQDEIIKTPAVLAQIKAIHNYGTFGPRMTEYSFRVTADGMPSKPESSNDYMKNTMRVYNTDLGIVHSHPQNGDPRPSQGDISTAKSIGRPNYEVSMYAIWVADGNGTARKVAELSTGKHGVLIVKFLDGTTLTAGMYPSDVRFYGPLRIYYGINPKTERKA